jgi:predicted N-acetyltransferase YhbS
MSEPQVIREIVYGSAEYRAELELRDEILRRPLGRQLSARDREGEENAYHIACFRGERVVGCLVLRPLGEGDVRMRAVAVATVVQRQGIGAALVRFAEDFARGRGYRRMVLHARETAVEFYEKLDYARVGERFVEVTIPHWRMEKRLDEPVDLAVK